MQRLRAWENDDRHDRNVLLGASAFLALVGALVVATFAMLLTTAAPFVAFAIALPIAAVVLLALAEGSVLGRLRHPFTRRSDPASRAPHTWSGAAGA